MSIECCKFCLAPLGECSHQIEFVGKPEPDNTCCNCYHNYMHEESMFGMAVPMQYDFAV